MSATTHYSSHTNACPSSVSAGDLHLCQQHPPADRRPHVGRLRAAPRRGAHHHTPPSTTHTPHPTCQTRHTCQPSLSLSHACNASQRRCSFSAAPAPTGRLHVYDVLWGEYLRKLGCGDGGGDGGGGGGGPCGGRFRLDYENTTTALMCAVRVGSPPAPSLSFFVESECGE